VRARVRVGRLLGTLAAVCTLAPSVARADDAPRQALLREGTIINVELAQTIKSNGTDSGDPIMFHVVSDVYSSDESHTLFIAKGSIAMGHVLVGRRRSHIGKSGKLTFAIDYAMATTGRRIYLRAEKGGGSGDSNKTFSIAATVLFGYAGLLIQGKDIRFNDGTQFVTYVDQDAVMTIAPVATTPAATGAPLSTTVPAAASAPTPN